MNLSKFCNYIQKNVKNISQKSERRFYLFKIVSKSLDNLKDYKSLKDSLLLLTSDFKKKIQHENLLEGNNI